MFYIIIWYIYQFIPFGNYNRLGKHLPYITGDCLKEIVILSILYYVNHYQTYFTFKYCTKQIRSSVSKKERSQQKQRIIVLHYMSWINFLFNLIQF